MKFRFNIEGRTIELEHLSLRDKYEAEKALGMGMSENETAAMLVPIVVAMHNENPERDWVLCADEALSMDVFTLEDKADDADPLETNGAGPDHRQPTGLPPLEVSESLSP